MDSQNASGATQSSYSLGEAATQFLLRLSPAERVNAQQAIYKFVRWYGEERHLSELTIPEVANYAEQITSSTIEATEKLGVIKSFLSYCYKQRMTNTNLSVHLRVKKNSSKSASPSSLRSQQAVLLTTQGYADLETELVTLKNERPRIAEELQKAAADKDFRENAPLDAAREYQGQVEARIRELESTLKMAAIMDEHQAICQEVSIGDTVVLRDLASGEEVAYTLVDAREANPLEGKISVTSPVGQALTGQGEGDKVEVRAPAGTLHYQIENIKHP